MTMGAEYRERIATQLRNGFETQQGLTVIWQTVCFEAMSEGQEHSAIRPLSTEARATWAKRALEAHYPGRVYEAFSFLLDNTVAPDVLEAFEMNAVEEVTKIELADKYASWSE